MGTPVKIREREDSCTGAGECTSRPMTEEEKIKYGIKAKEEKELKEVIIQPPEKEKLIEALSKVKGKTKAKHYAAKMFSVSITTIDRWLKQYGIEFDDEDRVICESEPKAQKQAPQAIGNSINDDTEAIQAGAIIKQGEITLKEPDKITVTGIEPIKKPEHTITIKGQETTKLTHRVGYAEYDIGNAVVQIDYRQELVKIGKCNNESLPTEEPISFEEAIAAAELILDVLGDEVGRHVKTALTER